MAYFRFTVDMCGREYVPGRGTYIDYGPNIEARAALFSLGHLVLAEYRSISICEKHPDGEESPVQANPAPLALAQPRMQRIGLSRPAMPL
jgi:hypothetical protein